MYTTLGLTREKIQFSVETYIIQKRTLVKVKGAREIKITRVMDNIECDKWIHTYYKNFKILLNYE